MILIYLAGFACAVLSTLIHGYHARQARQRERAAQAEWDRAHEAAKVAYNQARVIGQSMDLLCDDCRRIADGNYLANAAAETRAWLAAQPELE